MATLQTPVERIAALVQQLTMAVDAGGGTGPVLITRHWRDELADALEGLVIDDAKLRQELVSLRDALLDARQFIADARRAFDGPTA